MIKMVQHILKFEREAHKLSIAVRVKISLSIRVRFVSLIKKRGEGPALRTSISIKL